VNSFFTLVFEGDRSENYVDSEGVHRKTAGQNNTVSTGLIGGVVAAPPWRGGCARAGPGRGRCGGVPRRGGSGGRQRACYAARAAEGAADNHGEAPRRITGPQWPAMFPRWQPEPLGKWLRRPERGGDFPLLEFGNHWIAV